MIVVKLTIFQWAVGWWCGAIDASAPGSLASSRPEALPRCRLAAASLPPPRALGPASRLGLCALPGAVGRVEPRPLTEGGARILPSAWPFLRPQLEGEGLGCPSCVESTLGGGDGQGRREKVRPRQAPPTRALPGRKDDAISGALGPWGPSHPPPPAATPSFTQTGLRVCLKHPVPRGALEQPRVSGELRMPNVLEVARGGCFHEDRRGHTTHRSLGEAWEVHRVGLHTGEKENKRVLAACAVLIKATTSR